MRVYTNDTERPVVVLTLKMDVRDPVHMKPYRPREIFEARCRSCHVDRGAGRRGVELFSYDCLMCHGQGKSSETVAEMRNRPKGVLIKALRNGVEKTAMPAWALKEGGPLDDEQIESLVEFLTTRAK